MRFGREGPSRGTDATLGCVRRRLVELLVAATAGALLSAGLTYALVREEAPAPPKAAPTRPPEALVDSEQGLELCRGAAERVAGAGAQVAAAFDTTAGAYATAAATGSRINPPTGLTDFARVRVAEGPDTPLFVCYIHAAEPMAISSDPPHRVRALVDGYGGATEEVLGNRAKIKMLRPEEPGYWP